MRHKEENNAIKLLNERMGTQNYESNKLGICSEKAIE
jgi:hypothetical protein